MRIAVAPAVLFDVLDDPLRLGAHMQRPSAMMLGGWMRYHLGPEQGRGLGARLDFSGRVLGLPIEARQSVTDYDPPVRKAWHTEGRVRLIAIGPYRMGFEIAPDARGSSLRLFIDYAYPEGRFGRFRGALLAAIYARWCLTSMLRDAVAAVPRQAAG